jgi:hypothetical protein
MLSAQTGLERARVVSGSLTRTDKTERTGREAREADGPGRREANF